MSGIKLPPFQKIRSADPDTEGKFLCRDAVWIPSRLICPPGRHRRSLCSDTGESRESETGTSMQNTG
jgi:hypothetical protein